MAPPMGEHDDFKSHWDARVASFRAENAGWRAHPERQQIVMLGDSLTERFRTGAHFRGRPIANRGIHSDHLTPFAERSIMDRLAPELLAPNPSHVLVMGGINDVHRQPDAISEYLSVYERLLGELRQRYPRASLICQSLLPTTAPLQHLNAPILEFNRGLQALAGRCGAHYLNLNASYTNGRGELRRFASRDGLHLTRFSYGRWRRTIESYMGWSSTRGLVGLLGA